MADPTPPPGDVLAGVLAKIARLEKKVSDLESPSGTQRALAVRRLPFQDFQVGQSSGFPISGAWATYATVTLTVPEGRTQLQVLGVGTAAVLDQLTGGVTTSYGRLVIDGTPSREFPAAKDAGATFVNNVITATSARLVDVTAKTSVTIQLQLYGLNGGAYPANAQNFAQLAVIGSFTIA